MASSKPIIWSPEADSDLETILAYLEDNWAESIIQNFLTNLFNAMEWISRNPNAFMQFEKSESIRKYILSKQHSLYFEIFETHIALLRIFDNRQDSDTLKI